MLLLFNSLYLICMAGKKLLFGRFENLRYVARSPVCPPGSWSRFTTDFGGDSYP